MIKKIALSPITRFFFSVLVTAFTSLFHNPYLSQNAPAGMITGCGNDVYGFPLGVKSNGFGCNFSGHAFSWLGATLDVIAWFLIVSFVIWFYRFFIRPPASGIKANNKVSYVSFALGLISLLTILGLHNFNYSPTNFITLGLLIIFTFSFLPAIFFGLYGLKSNKKYFAIAGLILSVLDIVFLYLI